MQNFKLSVDLSSIYMQIKDNLIKEYSFPFFLVFLEADNPDDACYTFTQRLLHTIVEKDNSIESRIMCRKIHRHMRIYKVILL
jgi:hypothetical protein